MRELGSDHRGDAPGQGRRRTGYSRSRTVRDVHRGLGSIHGRVLIYLNPCVQEGSSRRRVRWGKGEAAGPSLSEKDFPPIGLESDPPCNSAAKRHSVRAADDFISEGMFRIAKWEEREWRQQQAREIKAMLFRSPQLNIVSETIQHLQKVSDENLDELDLVDLEVAARKLDWNCSMRKMDTAENPGALGLGCNCP
jgi:hypothetical protein